MRLRAGALLLAGVVISGAALAADNIGWYTASERAQSARSYWIAGEHGLVLLGAQLLPSEAEAMLREAQSRTGRKALMAVVLAATPEQFNGTAVLQKHGVKVYTSQQVAAAIPAAHAEAQRRLSAQFGKDYPAAEPKPVSYGEASRQMLIGGVQFQLRTLGPGPGVAHVAVEYDGQMFVGDLVAGPMHPVLSGGSLDAWFKRLQELRGAKPRRVFPAHGEPGGMALIANQMIYIKQLIDFVATENPRLPAQPQALARVKDKMLEAYPAYAAPERLDALVAAEWQRQAGNAGN
jgi:glyoxylase-like metal-dependent hydrolase (beta-lactamase superfamily II)